MKLGRKRNDVVIKGTGQRDFSLPAFSCISFLKSPEFPIKHISNFSKVCPRSMKISGKIQPPVWFIPLVHFDLQISSLIFEKNRNDPNVVFRGWGEDDS